MTQDEKVTILKEAGVWDVIGFPGCIDKLIDLVAKHERNRHAWTQEHWTQYEHAIAAAEREACAKESLEVLNNLREETIAQCQKGMIEAYKLGQSEEREACAKLCEDMDAEYEGDEVLATWCAAAIRSRSNEH